MEFYKELYISENLKKKKENIIEKLKQKKVQFHCYIISLTENPKNQLEFYDSLMLMQKNFKKDKIFIVGIANGYDGALEIIEKITEETYRKQGDADIRRFIMNNQNKITESEE